MRNFKNRTEMVGVRLYTRCSASKELTWRNMHPVHIVTVASVTVIKRDRLYALLTYGARWWPKVDGEVEVAIRRIWKCYGKQPKRRFRGVPRTCVNGSRSSLHGGEENRRCGFTRPLLALQNVGHSTNPRGNTTPETFHGPRCLGLLNSKLSRNRGNRRNENRPGTRR